MKTHRTIVTTALAIAVVLLPGVAQADDNAAARAVMQQTTERLLERLHAEDELYHEDEQRLYAMLEEVVLPVVDMLQFSKLVLGKHWKAADESQQQRFVENFQSMLMRSYGKTLLLLPDIKIEYETPVPGKPQNKYQIVRTKMLTSDNKPPVGISYALADREGWKVFDINIDGTSLVKQFRGSFDQEIRETGVDALLDRLSKFDAGETPPPDLRASP